MKKTIITIWGNASTGKSSTAKLVYDQFLNNYRDLITSIDDGPQNTFDITKIFKCINVIVGIESQGDPSSNIFSSLPKFVDNKCELIICTTRTRGKTADEVNRISEEFNYNVIWLSNLSAGQKENTRLNEILNKKTAMFIHEIIRDLFIGIY